MKFSNKNNFLAKIIYSNAILLFCLILIVFFSANLIRDFINKRELLREAGKLNKEINNLTEKNENLANLINYLKTSDFLEEEARTKLNKKKPGEEIIIIPASQPATSSTESAPTFLAIPENKNNFFYNLKKWWSYFFTARQTNE